MILRRRTYKLSHCPPYLELEDRNRKIKENVALRKTRQNRLRRPSGQIRHASRFLKGQDLFRSARKDPSPEAELRPDQSHGQFRWHEAAPAVGQPGNLGLSLFYLKLASNFRLDGSLTVIILNLMRGNNQLESPFKPLRRRIALEVVTAGFLEKLGFFCRKLRKDVNIVMLQ